MIQLTRREFLELSASTMVGSLIGACFSTSPSVSRWKERPNIVFLLTDDQRWDSMGSVGNTFVQTPNMDCLAADGVLCENTFVTSPVCMASRASIFTGMYERQHNCNFNRGDLYPQLWKNSYPLLLRNSGYCTAFVGKFGLAVSDMPHSCTTRNTYIATDANPEHLPAEDFDYWKGFAGQGAYFPEGPHGRHLTTLIADQAIEFLNNRQTDKPFCLSVSFKAPHLDFEPDPVDMHLYQNIEFPKPETAKQKYFEALPPCVQQSWGHTGYWQNYYSKDELYQDSVRKCYQLITGADRAIGRVMRELQRLGIRENTIIIMMSDNGYMKGEHFLGGKALLYEESIRVPLIISDPRVARSKQGRRNSELVLNIDLAPTILSMAGIEAPNNMDGRDITALVHGNNQNLREEFLCENNFRLGSKSDMPIWPDWSNQYYPFCSGLRTRTHKYIKYTEESPLVEELFDLTNDPLETVNLANIAEHKHILTMFRNQYDALTQKL